MTPMLWVGRDRQISEVWWSASLAKKVSYRFSGRPVPQNRLEKYKGRDMKKIPGLQAYMHRYVHLPSPNTLHTQNTHSHTNK